MNSKPPFKRWVCVIPQVIHSFETIPHIVNAYLLIFLFLFINFA